MKRFMAGCAMATCIHALALAEAANAQAASPASSASDPDASASDTGLQEIIVTAQRREESTQKAALAITSLAGADLVSAGVSDVTRLGTQVPGLDAVASGVSNVVFLRGVGNFVTTPISDSAVATNYDGVYAGRTASGFSFFDLQRVEVLKGPQGTLYGRNATGGAINIIPQRPSAGEFGGYGSISYGNYNDLQLESAFNLPLGQKGAFRASGYVRDRDGYL